VKTRIILCSLALLFVASGCFHATIDTGRTPSGDTISQKWASCWIFGLVPPKTVDAAATCPNGVAVVETQRSFLNQLVGMVTFGIYTPLEIQVTCASGTGADLNVDEDDVVLVEGTDSEEIREAFTKAAQRAVSSGHAVYVRFADEETGA